MVPHHARLSEASLGVMRRLCGTLRAPRKRSWGIKFTPYPIERKIVARSMATRRATRGGKMYGRENGMRHMPLGPAHIVRFHYNPSTGVHAMRDSRGFELRLLPIPDDKHPEVQAWEIAKNLKMPATAERQWRQRWR